MIPFKYPSCSIMSASATIFWQFSLLTSGVIGGPRISSDCSWRYKSNPMDCGSFLICNFGEPMVQRCPRGLHWNEKFLTCDWRRNARCSVTTVDMDPYETTNKNSDFSEDEEKAECTTQTFKPHPTTCSKYYVCEHGAWREMSCTPPLQWNGAVNTCDWPKGERCDTKPTPPPTTMTSTLGPVWVTTSGSTIGPPAPPPPGEDGDGDVDGEDGDGGPPAPPPKPITGSTPTPTPTPTPGPTSTDPTIVGIITGPATTPVNDDSYNPPDWRRIICYFTGWSYYRPGQGKFGPQDVDSDLCTHYVYAFAVLDSNTWTMKPADTWLDIDNKFYQQMTQLKKKGKKVTIALGGWNDSEGQKYSLMLRDPVKIQSLINSVSSFIREHDFDGIDLDYEYPVCPHGDCHDDFNTDRNGFSILIKGLRESLPEGSTISAAVSANKDIIDRAYDVRTLSSTLDWIGVMDYDIHGSWENRTGHIAPLYEHPGDTKYYLNVNYSIHHWISKGAEPSKLVMGIPLYGQAFTLKDPTSENGLFAPARGPGTPGTYSRQGGILSYYEICGESWSERVEDAGGRMGPFLVRGDQWVSYDDASFIATKMAYVREMGLGGAMVWALDFDDFNNKCGGGRYPLLNALSNALRDAPEK